MTHHSAVRIRTEIFQSESRLFGRFMDSVGCCSGSEASARVIERRLIIRQRDCGNAVAQEKRRASCLRQAQGMYYPTAAGARRYENLPQTAATPRAAPLPA